MLDGTSSTAATRRTRASAVGVLAALAIAVAVGTPGASHAQEAGVQVTPDTDRILVSKDINQERWAITRNDDGTVTGNVFPLGGGPPSFVWCEQLDGDDDDDDFFDDFIDFIDDLIGDDDDGDDGTDDELTFSCFGAGPCTDTPCTEDEWTFIADVTLPESFFRP
ncbi:MAG: hypothetical protein AB1689_10595 [Thermodesulfobacteriota bacterium]